MAERIATGEIYVGLDDDAALAGLRRVEADFHSTMRRIDATDATIDLNADLDQLKRDLQKAKAEVKKYETHVKASENNIQRAARERHLKKLREIEKERAAAVDAHQQRMKAATTEQKAEANAERRRVAIERRAAARARIMEQAERRRMQQLRQRDAFEQRMSKQRAREMSAAHTAALREEKDRMEAMTLMERQALSIRRLQREYSEAADKAERLARESRKIKTLAGGSRVQQRVSLGHAEAVARMEALRAELRTRGAMPIEQKVALDVDDRGVSSLGRWISAITETTVRIGPFTTTLAGLSRALLLLGPILSGVVGQFGALAAVLGAGLIGSIGVAAGALGALGISLGGVGFLMGGLVNEFKDLVSIQKAYRTAVLKYGADSDQAATKLKQFNHALGEVPPTTRRAFLSIDALTNRWNRLSQEAKPTFFNMLGEGITTINHHFDWFRKNTLDAFTQVQKGWTAWMEGLRSDEADTILSRLGEAGNKSIRPLMRGLGNLGTAFGRVAVSFSRHLPGLIKGFEAWSEGLADASGRTERLDRSADGLVAAMRSVGRLVAASGRVITAFFSPGVDDGTEMIDGWSRGLNKLAREMRTTKRSGIDDWFRDSIDTADKFWAAVKPLAELFFEWTTIMRPFANAALDAIRPLAEITQSAADLWPVRTALQVLFGMFLYGAIAKRVASVAASMGSIARAVVAIKAAGGIGAALKGGIGSFLTGGLKGRGSTPANPLFVMNVGPGGGLPGRGGKPGVPPVVGKAPGNIIIRNLPNLVKGAGVIGALAAGVVALTKAADNAAKSRGLRELDADVQKLVGKRDMQGLLRMKRELMEFGGNADDFIPGINRGIKALQRLNDQDLSRMRNSIDRDYARLRSESNVTFKRVSGLAKYHFDLIENTMTKGSAEARLAASRNFNRAKDAIKSAMKAGTISTERGLALINKLWGDALAVYGFSRKQAANIRKTGDPDANRGREGGHARARGGIVTEYAAGGLLQVGRKGERAPDNVPMNLGGVPSVVARGEQIAVFNDHQQKKFARAYPGGLEGFFAGHQPKHYAAGGIVPVPGFPGEMAASHVLDEIRWVAKTFGLILTDAYGAGHKSPGHTRFGTAADFAGPDRSMDAAVKALVAQGYLVGYDGRFGSQDWPGHGPSYAAPGNAHLHVEFGNKQGSLGAGMFEEIARIVMQKDLGVMSAVGQATLDTTRAAANENLRILAERAMSMVVPGGHGVGPGAGAATRAQMVRWATMALNATSGLGHGGATAANIAKILELAMKESSWIVDSINNWDSNAAAGNPSGGLMHVTIDKVGGSKSALFDPVTNMIASIRYQMKQYGNLITHSPYAMGGLVDTMGQKEWARGGKIERPTLMTGEDGRKAPEFVIGTNPMFRSSNLDALRAAASALGVPQARKSKKKKGPQYIKGEGKEPGRLDAVEDYRRLQVKEEDTLRNLSIAQSKVREPDSLITKVGTDSEGNDLFAIDQSAVNTYTAQLNAVMEEYKKLLDPGRILDQLAAAADRAYKRITSYVNSRQDNIAALDKSIAKDRRLSKSKDDDTARRAQSRLDKAIRMKQDQQQKIQDARGIRGEIAEDQKDARFRRQEYQVDRDNLQYDIDGVQTRATTDRDSANPQPPSATPPETDTSVPTLFEQTATLSVARQELLAAMGGNFAPVAQAISRAAFGQEAVRSGSLAAVQGAGGGAGYQAVVQGTSASGAVRSTQPVGGTPWGGSNPAWYQGPRVNDGSMRYAAGSGGGPSVHVDNINFPVAPSDAHTFSKSLLWELGSLGG